MVKTNYFAEVQYMLSVDFYGINWSSC